MKKYILLLISLVFISCATTPTAKVWRPWIETYGNVNDVKVGKNIKVNIIGEIPPFLNQNRLLLIELEKSITDHLERRGFHSVKDDPDYIFDITVFLDKSDSFRVSSLTSQTVFNSSSLNSMGIGVSAANIISNQSVQRSSSSNGVVTNTVSVMTNDIIYNYDFNISLKQNNNTIWEGVSTWQSSYLSPKNDIEYASRLLISSLPDDNKLIEISEIKETHVDNFFKLYLKNKRFSCPALPNPIIFNQTDEYSYNSLVSDNILELGSSITALYDLLINSEIAIPTDYDADEPISVDAWKQVKIVDQYLMKPSDNRVYIEVILSGMSEGYTVSETSSISQDEYNIYKKEEEEWISILKDYFDVYK